VDVSKCLENRFTYNILSGGVLLKLIFLFVYISFYCTFITDLFYCVILKIFHGTYTMGGGEFNGV